jgi:hypothetical protein
VKAAHEIMGNIGYSALKEPGGPIGAWESL